MKKTDIRWKPWAIVAGLVAAYSAIGFWLVPTVVKQQLPKLGESMLARQASVDEVSFNPYTLQLEMHGLRLAETDGTPLFAIGELAVELQWRTLVRRAWSFAEIRITEPGVHLKIAPDGKFNLAALAESFKSEPEESDLPRLIVERFLLERGQMEMLDQQAGYANRIYPIDLALNNFSTLPDRKGTHTFHADFPSGGRLSWAGESSVNPIGGSGTLTLVDGSLPELGPYLKPYTDATVATGKFEARLPYRFSYQDGRLAASLSDARLALHALSVHATGNAAASPLKAGADKLQFDFGLSVEQGGDELQLRLADAAFTATDLALANGKQTPFQLAQLGFAGGTLDLAARQAHVDRFYAEDGQLELKRDGKGQVEIFDLLGRFVAASRKTATSPETPAPSEASSWTARIDRVEASRFGAAIADEATGIKAHVKDFGLQLEGVSTDLSQPVRFNAGLGLQEGGQLSAQGEVVPGSSAVKADVHVKQLALSPLQPLLGQYVKLKIVDGKLSAQGRLAVNAGEGSSTSLRYDGSFDVASFALDEEDGERFASWKSVGADKLTASLGPDRLEIPELRIVEPNATLIINEDGTFNAARLLVKPASSGAKKESPPPSPSQAQPEAEEAFPVRIRRLRFQNAKLDFSDLSLLPQFGAKIYELNGVVTGLSSRRSSRSQIELDGRVDEFGLARIRGGLNAFAPRDDTNIKVAFKNIDLVSASPYSMKFAGYKIAEGKISLDLGYKVRDGQLEGDNQIVIDNLTLGERIDSPDALKLPLELAIAILKDSNGRIDLGLPVYGDMNDPQFSYGAIIWKAIGNVLTKIVTAPFRALAGMFGSGENIEAIEFDPGSDRLLPPEREKLQQVAQILARRAQLKLTVPGHYSEEADGVALKRNALRSAIAKRAGIKVTAEEQVGPLDLRARPVRSAVRALYAERFGDAELDRQKAAAEAAASAGEDGKATPASEKLSVWQRAGKLMDGEPQVADTGDFYRSLLERLQQSQPLVADALPRLGAQRANVILLALKEAGVDAASALAAAPEQVGAEAGKPVALKLGLSAK